MPAPRQDLSRRLLAGQTCAALLLALSTAPFQHVHTGADHDHGAVAHAHFYVPGSAAVHEDGAPHFADFDDDDHAAASALDSFTLVLSAGIAPCLPSPRAAVLFQPAETFQPVETVEARGHDPPCLDRSLPRAPPA